jgi:phage terminase large subunit-like protein
MVEFRQGFRSMAAPTRELEKLIVSRTLAHGGNPVTRWMAANVAIAQDPAGNLKPAKGKSTERIDGIGALIMAIGRALVAQEEPQPEYSMSLSDPLDGANVAVAQDPAGNLRPAKDKSTERIDGIVALIMAIGRAMIVQEEPHVEYQLIVF